MNDEQDRQYLFQFECSEIWGKLTETDDEKIRHCLRCDKNVHLIRNNSEFIIGAKKGKCLYAAEIRTAGIPAQPTKYDNLQTTEAEKVRALPIWYRLIQFVLFFIITLPIVSFLPLFIQKTMTRNQTPSGDVIDYDWKFRTFYAFLSNYAYFRPEENFSFWLVVNFGLACFYAFAVSLIIVYMIIFNWQRKSLKK